MKEAPEKTGNHFYQSLYFSLRAFRANRLFFSALLKKRKLSPKFKDLLESELKLSVRSVEQMKACLKQEAKSLRFHPFAWSWYLAMMLWGRGCRFCSERFIQAMSQHLSHKGMLLHKSLKERSLKLEKPCAQEFQELEDAFQVCLQELKRFEEQPKSPEDQSLEA